MKERRYSKPVRTREMTPREALRSAQHELYSMKEGESRVFKGASINGHQVIYTRGITSRPASVSRKSDSIKYTEKSHSGRLHGARIARDFMTGEVGRADFWNDRGMTTKQIDTPKTRSSEAAGASTIKTLNARAGGVKKGSSGHSGG